MWLYLLKKYLWRTKTPEMAYQEAIRYTQANLREQNRKFEGYLLERISQLEAQIEIQPLKEKGLFPSVADQGMTTTVTSEVQPEPVVVKQAEPVATVPPPSLAPPLITLVPTLPILVKKTAAVSGQRGEIEPEEEEERPTFTRYEDLSQCWTHAPAATKSGNPAPASPEAPPFSENLQSPPQKAKPQRALVFVTTPAAEETIKPPDQIPENASRTKLVTFAPATPEAPPETEVEQSWLPPPRFARFKPVLERTVDETKPPEAD